MSTGQIYNFSQVAAHLAPLFSITAVLSGFFYALTQVMAFCFYGRFGLFPVYLQPFLQVYPACAGVTPARALDLFIRATFQTIVIKNYKPISYAKSI